MKKIKKNGIGTHNSATGEKGKDFLSWIITPFCKCQTKSIAEQWRFGCRYFDLRVRYDRNGKLCVCHGLWKCDKTFGRLIREIGSLATLSCDTAYLMVTYEGGLSNKNKDAFVYDVRKAVAPYNRIILTEVNAKFPKWRNLDKPYDNAPTYTQGYKVFGLPMSTFIPIPWVWNIFVKAVGKTYKEKFVFIDFL